MAEEEISPELDRVLRTVITVGGQLAERVARARADQDRARHAADVEERRRAEQNVVRQVEAGRSVYGGVREPVLWDQPNAQRRLGEALAVSDALRDVDPLAVAAHQYFRGEARRRFGEDADAWLATAVQMYLEEARELADRDDAAAAASEAEGAEEWAKIADRNAVTAGEQAGNADAAGRQAENLGGRSSGFPGCPWGHTRPHRPGSRIGAGDSRAGLPTTRRGGPGKFPASSADWTDPTDPSSGRRYRARPISWPSVSLSAR